MTQKLFSRFEESSGSLTLNFFETEYNLLPSELYNLCRGYLDTNPDLSLLPKADPASCDVFLPPDMPVVFKLAGIEKSMDRFIRMCMIRELCKENNYTHLVIAKARLHGSFIIEEKLPLKELTQKGQIGLYCENPDAFSESVQEFTKLLYQTFYSDILTFSHPYRQEIPLGRYDNIPFFLHEGIGKIGLIDLEGVEIRKENISQEELFQVAHTAISLFPLHFHDILSVLEENFPQISFNKRDLEEYKNNVLENFNSIYRDHRLFIERNQFSVEPREEIEQIGGSDLTMKAIVQKLLNKFALERSTCSQDLSIAHVCSRTLTLSIEDLTEEHEEDVKSKITHVLEELKRIKEICFANIYSNRAKKTRIRIHI